MCSVVRVPSVEEEDANRRNRERQRLIGDRTAHINRRKALLHGQGIDIGKKRERIVLKGELPSPLDPPPGCAFNTRCPYATERCRAERPAHRAVGGRLVSCHYAEKFL